MTSIALLIKVREYVCTGRYPVQASAVFLNELIISLSLTPFCILRSGFKVKNNHNHRKCKGKLYFYDLWRGIIFMIFLQCKTKNISRNRKRLIVCVQLDRNGGITRSLVGLCQARIVRFRKIEIEIVFAERRPIVGLPNV